MISIGREIYSATIFVLAVVFIAGCNQSNNRQQATADPVREGMSQARAHFDAGRFDASATSFDDVIRTPQAKADPALHFDALLGRAAAEQALGRFESAASTLEEAIGIAEELNDRRKQAIGLNSLAGVCLLESNQVAEHSAHSSGTARPNSKVCDGDPLKLLTRASELVSNEDSDEVLGASIENNLGNFYLDRLAAEKNDFELVCKNVDEAENHFRNCVNMSADNDALAAKAECNLAVCAIVAAENSTLIANVIESNSHALGKERIPEYRKAVEDWCHESREACGRALERVRRTPANFSKSFVLLAVGDIRTRIKELNPGNELDAWSVEACYKAATVVAQQAGDLRSLSYAMGNLGRLDEQAGRFDAAQARTRQAVTLAEQARIPDALFRWQWQTGRILRATGDRERAIAFYRMSLQTLGPIHSDLAIGNGNMRNRSSLRHDIGPLYSEAADLLLRKSETADPREAQILLTEARDIVESLKSAQLDEYFADDCLNVDRKADWSVDKIDARSAVIYIIPLPDRTELLVGLPGGLKRYSSEVGAEELSTVASEFRSKVVYHLTNEYRESGSQLYKWLVSPLLKDLEANDINTLVFVPDGFLRSVPMAALYDSENRKHLIEKYAVAVTPGLKIMNPNSAVGAREKFDVLLGGLSKAKGDQFPALVNVPVELDSIQRDIGGQKLLDGDFVLNNFETTFETREYTVLHIASHGVFAGDARATYLVTYDDNAEKYLTLPCIERLIRPRSFSSHPVELLTLSACQTAAGDDRAALGLAGIAVKAGARSAVATLWCVSDNASTVLVSNFYHELHAINRETKQRATKAQALRAAQLKLLADENPGYHHPYYWAPFLVIGNWL